MNAVLDLPAIKKLCEAALDGPWESQPHQELAAAGNFFTRWDIITQQKRLVVKGIYGSDDAEFIAQARTLVPQLVEALEEAQKIVDILKPTMNLGVVQVPPPIQDHDRLYALKDAINAYDAILGDSE